MPKKLFVWVGACWIGILATTLIELTILGYLLWLLVQILNEYDRGWAVIVASLLAVTFFTTRYYLTNIQLRRRSEQQHQMAGLTARLNLIRRLVEPICVARKKPVPVIALAGPEDFSVRAVFGMVDQPIGTDFLLIHRDMPGVLTDRQMTGILCHEMRHADGIENWFTLLAQTLRLTLFVTTILTVVILAENWLLGIYNSQFSLLPVIGTILLGSYIGGSISTVFGNFRSQFIEFKTDALSVIESRSAADMISALRSVEQIVKYEFRRLQILTGNGLSRWRFFSTHPSTAARERMLRWVYL